MTRVLFFTDLHLEAGREYATDRLADQEQTLNDIRDIAVGNSVDLVIFGGDAYHRPQPSNPARHVLRRFTAKLAAAGITAVAVHGNAGHDIEAVDRPSALELEQSDWVRVSRVPELILAAGDIAVVTLPSVPMHRLVAAQNGGDRHEIFQQASEMLVEAARGLYAQAPGGWPVLLVGHWACDWPALPPQVRDHEPVLPLGELVQIGFDGILMGHIHIPAHIGVAISGGPPAHVSFGEEGLDHGCWLLDLTDVGMTAQHVAIPDRRFVTIDVDLTSETAAAELLAADQTDVIAAAIMEAGDLEEAVVRLRYKATESQHRRVDQAALKGFCMEAGAHRVYQIAPDIVRESRARAEHVDESIAPLEALAAWCVANDVDDASASALRDLTTELLGAVA